MIDIPLHLPQGACRQPDGSVLWRLWAPNAGRVDLILVRPEGRAKRRMESDGTGYFTHCEETAADGLRYLYRLNGREEFPDPASRWQPDGVHRPSAVHSPGDFSWHDAPWCGVLREDLVIYELHVGTFTPEGTFEAIVPRLASLRELGVTAIEIMPVAQFPGERDWGYDGVHPFAVQASYGGPRGLQSLVDAAHREGLGVVLDVVYNHLGPEGNYLARFGPYFTDRYHTPWGSAINFDGPQSDAVRQFCIDNAVTWVRDFHVDGLRLDAVQSIFDFSARHILADIQVAVQREAAEQGRPVHVIAETDQNDVRLLEPPQQGGFGLDGVWSDDFHHSVHALLTGERHSYYQDFGPARSIAKAYNEVFVHDGSYSAFHRRRHGSRAGGLDRARFIVCLQNHDQVGNRALERLAALVPPEAQRLACALLLLSPCTPLLFMGEEYGETRPFPYFCSFEDVALIEAVRRSRRQEFAAMVSHRAETIPDPQAVETFHGAKLHWQWCEGTPQAARRRLYAALLAARHRWPPLADRTRTVARSLAAGSPVEVHTDETLLVIERGGPTGLLAIANCSGECRSIQGIERGGRELLLSTEEARFGGRRASAEPLDPLLPHELRIFGQREWQS